MTSNSTLKTPKKLGDIVYDYYKGLCIFKAGMVLERSRESQHLSAQSHKMSRRIPSPIDVNRTDAGPTVIRRHRVLISYASGRRSLKLMAKCHALSTFILFHRLHSNTMPALLFKCMTFYKIYIQCLSIFFGSSDYESDIYIRITDSPFRPFCNI